MYPLHSCVTSVVLSKTAVMLHLQGLDSCILEVKASQPWGPSTAARSSPTERHRGNTWCSTSLEAPPTGASSISLMRTWLHRCHPLPPPSPLPMLCLGRAEKSAACGTDLPSLSVVLCACVHRQGMHCKAAVCMLCISLKYVVVRVCTKWLSWGSQAR